MRQIRNFGFVAPLQEPHVHHAPRPCGGAGQLGGQPACAQHALCHPHHPAAHRQGLGSHIPVGDDHQQLTDRAVPPVQIPAPQRTGAAGHPLLRRMGGGVRTQVHRL